VEFRKAPMRKKAKNGIPQNEERNPCRSIIRPYRENTASHFLQKVKVDDLVKSLLERHPGESRGPEHLEITGFRLSPE
jgi:hypothetical protein